MHPIGDDPTLVDWWDAVEQDRKVTDILFNRWDQLFVERDGEMRREGSPFGNEADYRSFIDRILLLDGRRWDASYPFVDGGLPDGSRFHLTFPPVSGGSILLAIRRLNQVRDLTLNHFLAPTNALVLTQAIALRRNILICGSTGAGKTTLLSLLLDGCDENERVLVLEERQELVCRHLHTVRLQTRVATPEGRGEVTLRHLLRNALRMRPDRLVLGEVRGAEAFDLVQALSSGHSGSLATLHAGSCGEGLRRLEALALLAHPQLTPAVLREWIAGAIQLVVRVERRGGSRQVVEIMELCGMEGSRYRYQPIALDG